LSYDLRPAAGQALRAVRLPVQFVLSFSRPVQASALKASLVRQTGTATGLSWTLATIDASHYTLTLTGAAHEGTVVPSLPLGVLLGQAGQALDGGPAKAPAVELALALSLTGVPASVSRDAALHATVTGVDAYLYRVGIGLDCADPAVYPDAPRPVAQPLTADLTSFPDAELTLCVLGVAAPGMRQLPTRATVYKWRHDATAPISQLVASTVAGPALQVGGNLLLPGVAQDAGSGVARVEVMLSRDADGFCLGADGLTFRAVCPVWLPADGTSVWGLTVPGASLIDGTYSVAVRATDQVGNVEIPSNLASLIWDGVGPQATIQRGGAQLDPANTVPVVFALSFDEPVDPATLGPLGIVQMGTATGVTWTLVDNGDHRHFKLLAGAVATSGTLIPRLVAGAVRDLAGNPNAVATGGLVTFDNQPVAVHAAVADGQSSPAKTLPIRFTFTFDSPLAPSSLQAANIQQNGSALGVTWRLSPVGSSAQVYAVEATAVAGAGTVMPLLQAGTVHDVLGNLNSAQQEAPSVDFDPTLP